MLHFDRIEGKASIAPPANCFQGLELEHPGPVFDHRFVCCYMFCSSFVLMVINVSAIFDSMAAVLL